MTLPNNRTLKDKIPEIFSFSIYVIVSFIIGSLILPYCTPFTGDGIDVKEVYKPVVIAFVLISAIGGPISYVYKTKFTPVGVAIILGLGTGLGIFTVYALIKGLDCVEGILMI